MRLPTSAWAKNVVDQKKGEPIAMARLPNRAPRWLAPSLTAIRNTSAAAIAAGRPTTTSVPTCA